MRFRSVTISILSVLAVVALLVSFGVGTMWLYGCGDTECLAWQEECSEQYKKEKYGRTDIPCCEGRCVNLYGDGTLYCGTSDE